jgi:CheY-like chemotaxis protein
LAGGVAHDFNNLLTVIGGYAGMVLDDLPPRHPLREPIETIAESTERAAALTRQLLTFSRRQRLELKALSLNDLLANLEKMLRRFIAEDIELVFDLDPATPPIRADAGQIEQVVTNLLLNARDAMPDGGRIVVRTAAREAPSEAAGPSRPGFAELTVADTGTGMAPEILSRVFEPFFTTKPQGKGTGLGLSIVYGIVRQTGGTIDVRSEPGRGATFEIRFPAVEETSDLRAPENAQPFVAGRAGDTILVAEDEPGVRAFVSDVLRSNGYRVLEAQNGRDALRLAAETPGRIDLLLTDMVMPEMGGQDLAERLAEARPGVPVLFMSGYTERAAASAVADRLISKPFRATELLRRVRASIAPRDAFGRLASSSEP